VDLLTGRAEITIPLGSITTNDLTAPFLLAYESSGIKPHEAGGNAGVNWNLVAGGSVRREVRSLPDDYQGNSQDTNDNRRGWLVNGNAQLINSFVPNGDDNLTVCADEASDWSFINGLGYQVDTEPDIFSFNAPGLSGQFVFGADMQPKLIPYQDLKVEPQFLSGKIVSITITRNDGVKYVFAYAEKTVRKVNYFSNSNAPLSQFSTELEQYRKSTEFTSAWNLTKIQTVSGNEITFCYGSCGLGTNHFEDVFNSEREVRITNTGSNATSQAFRQYKIKDVVTSSFLSSIYSRSMRVEFLYTHYNRLVQVNVVDQALGNRKVFKLNYKAVRNPSEDRGKEFLFGVTEASNSCENFPSFTFEYYDVTPASSYQTTSLTFNRPTNETEQETKLDYWGYFNNTAESKNPTVYFFAAKSNAERYRYYPITGQSPTATINGANRAVNSTTVVYGSLKKITYPTGGTATITYEPNQYHDHEANLTQYGPGIRTKKIEFTDPIGGAPSTIIEYEYKTTSGGSSGKMVYRSVFGYHDVGSFYAIQDDQSPSPIVLYQRATRKQAGLGSTSTEFLLPGTYPLVTDAPDWTASKVKIARASCVSVGQLTTGHYLFPYPDNTTFDFERGLVSKVTQFKENGDFVTESNFTYQRLTTTSQVVKGLRFQKLNGTTNLASGANSNSNLFVYSHYNLLANVGKVMVSEATSSWDMTDQSKLTTSTTNYTFSNVHQMLTSMSTANSDGIIHKTRYKYAKDFNHLTQPLSSDVKSMMIKKMNDENLHGTIIETITSIDNGTETITNASLGLFGSFPDSLNTKQRVLPIETRTFTGTGGYQEATVTPASGANQVLTFNPAVYRLGTTVTGYDYADNPLGSVDASKNRSGVHYGYKKTTPVLEIDNGLPDEVVYNGFETYTGYELNIVAPSILTLTNGWTGRKAAQLDATKVLEKNVVTKGLGRYYKFSCRVLASSSRQINFKVYNGATLVVTGIASYASGDAGQWRYLEGRVDMNSAPSTFKLRVDVSGTLTIDDILFYPESSTVSTFTHEPLIGRTSQTNSNGITAFSEYDNLGRLKYISDQDKGLRQMVDYYFAQQAFPVISADIYATHAVHQVVKDVTVQYTANTSYNCGLAPLTYDWYVDGVKLGSNTTSFQYQYTQAKVYVLKLVVSHPVYQSAESTIVYDVKNLHGTGPITVGVTDNAGTNSYAYCDPYHTKTFTAALNGCYVLQDVSVVWFYKTGTVWNEIVLPLVPSDPRILVFDPIVAFNGIGNLSAYQIKCEVSTTCPITGNSSFSSSTLSISYNDSTQCQ